MVENVNSTKNTGETRKPLLPVELTEANWRFWSFILLALIAIYLMTEFQVPVVQGLTDPFYSPTILVLPLVAGFRATCYAYRKDYHRHLFNHPNACNIDVRKDFKGRKYTGETRLFRLENYHRYFWYTSQLQYFHSSTMTYTFQWFISRVSHLPLVDCCSLSTRHW